MFDEQIEEYYNEHFNEMLKSLDELVRINSVYSEPSEGKPFGKGSSDALEWVQNFGKKIGLKTRNIDNYAVALDWDDENPELAILSHVDVVPVNADDWNFPPFECTVKDGNIYGRGTVDDKGPTVAVLYAIKCLKELGVKLDKSFRMVVGGNEERGCQDIAYYEKKEPFPEMVITPDGSFPVLNCEKGMIHITFSAPYDDIYVCGGSVINAIPDKCVADGVNYIGKASHGSRPENGENAVTKFLELYKGESELLNNLSKLFPHGEYNGKSLGLGFSDNVSGEMTCALTILKKENDRLCCGMDIRYPIDKTLAEMTEIVTSSLEKAGFTIDTCDGMEPHYVDENSKLVRTLLNVYEKVSGKKGECIAEGGVTYVHNTKGGVAFGAEFPWENNNMHGADEHIPVDTFRCNFMMYAHAIMELTKE